MLLDTVHFGSKLLAGFGLTDSLSMWHRIRMATYLCNHYTYKFHWFELSNFLFMLDQLTGDIAFVSNTSLCLVLSAFLWYYSWAWSQFGNRKIMWPTQILPPFPCQMDTGEEEVQFWNAVEKISQKAQVGITDHSCCPSFRSFDILWARWHHVYRTLPFLSCERRAVIHPNSV